MEYGGTEILWEDIKRMEGLSFIFPLFSNSSFSIPYLSLSVSRFHLPSCMPKLCLLHCIPNRIQ